VSVTATKQSVVPPFRREAIEFQQYQRQWGDVVLLQPISSKILTWSLIVSTVMIILFLSFAQFARKDTASGYLTPTSGTAKVFLTQQGVISEVFVREGQQVSEGQPLLRVSTNQLSGGGEDVNAVAVGILESQKDALIRQIAGEEQRMTAEQRRLSMSLDSLQNQAALLQNQIEIQHQRVRIGERLVTMATILAAKGLESDVERKHREQAVLDDTQKFASMAQQAAALKDHINETRQSLEQLPTVTMTKLQPVRTELSNTEQRIAEIGARRGYLVRAPITGRVSLLQANPGRPADPRHLEMEIVPPNAKLEAVLFVPARAGGFVQVGQQVRLLYDSFPYQRYGTHIGHVVEVSQTVLTASDISGPVVLKEPAYKVIASLDESAIKTRDKKTIPLQPDMLLRADIILEQRTIMGWLLEPILSARM
jgi:membrane fusion protein